MSNPRTPLPTRLPPAPRKSSPWLLVSVVGGCLAAAVIVIGGLLIFGPSPPPVPPVVSTPAQPAVENKAAAPEATATEAEVKTPADDASPVIDDDGKTLWVSPTKGKPLDLAYLPPGCQVIVSVRLADISRHPEGLSALFALGPDVTKLLDLREPPTLVSTAMSFQSPPMVVGIQTDIAGKWLISKVVPVGEALTLPQAKEYRERFENRVHEYNNHWYGLMGDYAFYLTPSADKIVIAPETLIKDIIDLNGAAPPLRRDIERLMAYTDSDRQLTIVFSPNSLFALGEHLFAGEFARLQAPLSWFLGDGVDGYRLRANLDTNLFLELVATPTLDTSTEKASQMLANRVAQIPDKIEQYVVNLNAQPYGRLVIARFPEMLRKLATYTRSGFEKDHAVLRCYLPAIAGHNLLLAAELTLAEQPGSLPSPTNATAAAQAKAPDNSASVKDRLAKVTSLKFARDTLESALEQLSQDIGAPIVIRGPDLQADGITKNQSFGIDLSDKPAEEILVEILRLANPDKAATGPNDKRQKLVYVVEAKPDKTEQIVVTTRAKAAERKQELPAAFRVEKP